MSESVNDSGFVEWLRGLFEDADAASMFQWVIVAWLVLVVAMVVLDRLGTGLLGRSRPLEQVPPERARTWRWGRRTPPPTYSLLPTGTVDEEAHTAPIVESIPLSTRPLALPAGTPTVQILANADYWRWAGDPAAPLFGYENNDRLARGEAPERYNPVTGRVESLDRDATTGALLWPGDVEAPRVLGGTIANEMDTPDVAAEAPTVELADLDAEPDFDAEPDGDEPDGDEDDGEATETMGADDEVEADRLEVEAGVE